MGYEQVAPPVAAAGTAAKSSTLPQWLQMLTKPSATNTTTPLATSAAGQADPKAVNNNFTYTPDPWSSPQAGLASLRGQDIYNDPSSAAYVQQNPHPNMPTPQMQGWVPQAARGQYVDNLYQQMLGRGADAPGKEAWMAQMSNGVSPGQVMTGVQGSQEYAGKPIEDMYQQLLGRGSDAAGKANWLSQLQGGTSLGDIRSGMMGSQEYMSAHPQQAFAMGGPVQSPFQMGLASLGGNNGY